ncbi:pre-mRNA-processing factor 17-like [Clavelina lepadiformis]|uniref:Pre-mRNA-processing factor 17 n=1 Tax=Clavelina lepadiformis TaxID=159417 RepID=A0ABP0EXU1_CLALP
MDKEEAIFCLKQAYAASSSDDNDDDNADSVTSTGTSPAKEEELLHLKPPPQGSGASMALAAIKSNPDVITKHDVYNVKVVDHVTNKVVSYNPTFAEMHVPEQGPANPFKTRQQLAQKNTLSGYVQEAHVSHFNFETQRRTFHSYGFAVDPSIEPGSKQEKLVVCQTDFDHDPDEKKEEEIKPKNSVPNGTKTVFEKIEKRPEDKRKRVRKNDPEDIEGFMGPWGGFVNEVKVAKPSEEMQKELDEITAKRQKKGKVDEEKTIEEKSTLHVPDPTDYQGRTYLHIPQDVGINLKSDVPPDKCYLPKRLIHTWSGHTKAVSSIRLFPKSGHLLLSTSMDCKVKLWEVYHKRRLLRTFSGHAKAVRDACFNADGTQFLTAAYDRFVKLWDTETGKCLSKFSSRKIPYCVKFNPDLDKQHLFVAGLSDKKILTWDIRSGETVQEYDRHLGAVNTITFIDNNTKFVSTSDDKSLRVWEWDIPVDYKYIADPSMHSMPAVTLAPNGKWLGCQSLDNRIVIFDVQTRFRLKRKKIFKGHMVAGYACQLDFSPDMSYIASGDGDGKVFIWDWKTTKLYSKFQAHDSVCIGCTWHPHETSKLITCGWDGQIKLWD